MPFLIPEREQKDLSQGFAPHKRSSQKAFHKPKGAHKAKGRCAWKKERPQCRLLSIFARGASFFLFEFSYEVAYVFKAAVHGNFQDAAVAFS